jgi:hypothetical protein
MTGRLTYQLRQRCQHHGPEGSSHVLGFALAADPYYSFWLMVTDFAPINMLFVIDNYISTESLKALRLLVGRGGGNDESAGSFSELHQTLAHIVCEFLVIHL